MRVSASCVALLLGACGGPPIGSHVPKANPTYVAGGAAAAAALLTIADPDGAGKRPEAPQEENLEGGGGKREMVPASVLDRADAHGEGCAEVDGSAAAPKASEPEGAPPAAFLPPATRSAVAPAASRPCEPTGVPDKSDKPTGASDKPTGASDKPTGASGKPTGASDKPTGASDKPTGASN
jgi:hypothetical protein